MAVIRPFRALRPQAERAQAVASVPYDVVNTEEARALTCRGRKSISRPEPIFTAMPSIAKRSKTSKNSLPSVPWKKKRGRVFICIGW